LNFAQRSSQHARNGLHQLACRLQVESKQRSESMV